MFDSANIIVGLEIGTSKVCAVVGEVNDGGALNIIGIGQSKSRGVRKGEIVDPSTTEEDVRAAIAEAEQRANAEIRSVYLGITGGHVRGFNNRGQHPVVSADREITEEDVEDVINNAKAFNLPRENQVVHSIRQHFIVDGQKGVSNPVGMFGAKVEVDMHVIHGHLNRLQNPTRVVRGLQLEVEAIVFTGLASALSLLTNEQKEIGALVIDIGAGTTEYVLYSEGIIKHTGVLAVGGDHVSNDIGYGLKIPMGRAEQFKLEHGGAIIDNEIRGKSLTIPSDIGLPGKIINLEHLRQIMSLRLEEIFRLIADELEATGLLDHVRAGVFLCGGGARIPQIQTLAEKVLEVPTYIGRTHAVSGGPAALDQPEFATPIGLVKYGSFQQKRKGGGGLFGSITELFKR